ncbi:SusF/SusE family outer membrane protein [Ichthyenterobacterium sp. W332]|uniref:SusF/SusE family outer membrane protein n=2 Tax=Microcosmobacter mediterraneus TaxID=3075607 RepID=A0ABU2YJ38_9FLAO|nr:SusF/SusE family outer membrane protein [Ichthyenterobacterium sp. W332]MDT0558189.1 SusF/SusE family outer membrane protein [Ichthyenterobacterium sp. W332]
MKLIDSLIYHPLKVNRELLPFYVFYSQIKPSDQFKSEVNFYLDNLEFDTNNLKESNLIKNISSYGSQVQTDYFNDNEANFIAPFLKEINVANPVLIFGFSALNNFSSVNNSFFNIQHQEQMLELIQTESFRNALISTNRQNELILIFISDYMDDIYYNMKSVKDYEPGVKLFYNNVGVLGSATTNGWEKSIPMTLIDAKLNIWEIKIVLKEGGVKFRTNESWTTNWGGETFPKGECIYFGDNIEVKEAGYYHIRLDLLKKNYQFIPIEND